MKTVIFDFDGTIADSFPLALEILRQVIKDPAAVSDEQVPRLRKMSLLELARHLRVPLWKIPFLAARARRQVRGRLVHIPLSKGVATIIKQLHGEDYHLMIMSSNSRRNIELFLRRHELNENFHGIMGSIGVFGKARALRGIVRQQRLDKNQVVYVGDEVRDIEGAHAAGVKVIAVGWGYNDPKSLAEHQPEAVASTPAELLAAVKHAL